MKLSKSRVSAAIAMVLGAACVVPSISFGTSIDVGVPGGRIASADGGDMLLFPFYTVTNEAGDKDVTTNFSVTNTSDKAVAVKFRFREQKRSVDVFDFTGVLSPRDKFDFVVKLGPTGRPQLVWKDNTCVVIPSPHVDPDPIDPVNGVPTRTYDFPDVRQFGVGASDSLVGHLEVYGLAVLGDNGAHPVSLGMNKDDYIAPYKYTPDDIRPVMSCVNGNGQPNGKSDCTEPKGTNISLAAAAKHINSSPDLPGKPANCDIINKFFDSPESVNKANEASISPVSAFFGDAPNSLTGRYVISIANRGIEGGSDPITVRNSQLTNEIYGPTGTQGGQEGRVRYVTSQTDRPCFGGERPSKNCRPSVKPGGFTWDQLDWFQPHLGTMPTTYDTTPPGPGIINRLGNLQTLLQTKTALSSDWSINPTNRVGVDWIVSFPAKYVGFNWVKAADCGGTGNDPVWCESLTPYGTPAKPVGAPAAIWKTRCAGAEGPKFWDRDEQLAFSFVVSPVGTGFAFCNEVNVLNLTPKGKARVPSMIQDGGAVIKGVFDGLMDNRGWAWIPVDMRDAVAGINFTSRSGADPKVNNATMTDLKKD